MHRASLAQHAVTFLVSSAASVRLDGYTQMVLRRKIVTAAARGNTFVVFTRFLQCGRGTNTGTNTGGTGPNLSPKARGVWWSMFQSRMRERAPNQRMTVRTLRAFSVDATGVAIFFLQTYIDDAIRTHHAHLCGTGHSCLNPS